MIKNINTVLLLAVLWLAAGCDDDNKSGLALNGENFITSFTIDGQEGEIDQIGKTIEVFMPVGTDLAALTPAFTLSEGAVSNIPSGSTVNFIAPVVYTITNGSTYLNYTVKVRCYEALITSFVVNDADDNKYTGVIDEASKTIELYVPGKVDLTRLRVNYVLSKHAQAVPATNSVYDFTSPVTFTVTNHGAKSEYLVKVVASDMPVTAFMGTAATVDDLKDEEKAAAQWMLNNIPRSIYVSMRDLISGAVKLDPEACKAIWWHGDDGNWPSQAWDSREAVKAYYQNGGNLLLSRYAIRYINDVYQIAKNQQGPNAEGGEAIEQLPNPGGFKIGDATHSLFSGLEKDNEKVYLISAGLATTNHAVQWNVTTGDYAGLDDWSAKTGAVALAYDVNDGNLVSMAEFPARSKGAGKVICIGSAAFEWNLKGTNASENNRHQLVKNAINYLIGFNE